MSLAPNAAAWRGLLLGALLASVAPWALRRLAAPAAAPAAPSPALVDQMRAVARLEALELEMHRKVDFAPEPEPAGSTWAALTAWAREALAPSHGRAIVFAKVTVGFDLAKLAAADLRADGDTWEVRLPPPYVKVELQPAETEVLRSNLDSRQTALMLQAAADGFAAAAARDPALLGRARRSAENALSALLHEAGLAKVRFLSG